jgi:TonB family protein
MILPSVNDEISPNTPGYVFEIQQIFRRENLPVGTEYAMLAVADSLARETDLRRNLGRTVQAIIHREGGKISAMELLSLILMASASPSDSMPGDQLDRAMHQILGFILEIRQPLQPAHEADMGSALIGRRERLSSRPEPHTSVWPLEKPWWAGSSRAVVVLALCGILAAFLIVRHSTHQQPSTDNAGVAMQESNAADAPNTSASIEESKQGTKSLPSHKSELRSKARVPVHKESGPQRILTLRTAPPDRGALALPAANPWSHSSRPSANIASTGVSLPTNVKSSAATRRRTAAPTEVSTAAVAPALPVSTSKPASIPRGLVQSGSAGIMAANLIWSPTPAYPAAASEARVEGEVTVNALVGKDGNVLSATVVSGPPLLREAALKAVEKWQYHPYLVSGKPAVMATTAIVDFALAHD